jgi:hypothetical protein
MPGVFLVGQDTSLVKLNPATPLQEKELQELIARHPALLGGCTAENEEDERRLLLVRREMGVPDQENGNNRWSMDHFFIDQSAVPTLVEVKRSKNREIRREIVGQLLDYAANGVLYWPQSEIKEQFQQQWGLNAECVLEGFLEETEFAEEDFWRAVENNLRRGNIRLVFVADELPPQLRRVIEFLNEQMKDVEVLGVELPQFKTSDDKQRAIAPSVIGRTSAAVLTKGRGERRSYEHLDAVVADFRALPGVPAVSNHSSHYRQLYLPGIGHSIHFEFLQFVRKGILCEFHVETAAPSPDLDTVMRELDGTLCAGSKVEYFQRGRNGALRVVPRNQQNSTVIAETMREFILIAQPKLHPVLA